MLTAKAVLAIETIKDLLADDQAIILDTETSGLDRDSEVLQLGAINMNGDVLFNQYFMPITEVSSHSAAINGITMDLLLKHDAKPFEYWASDVVNLISDRSVVTYNKSFDYRQIAKYVDGIDRTNWHCVMRLRQQIESCFECGFCKPLNGSHDAVGDCLATLALMKELSEISVEDIEFESLDQVEAIIQLLDSCTQKRLKLEKTEKRLKEFAIKGMRTFSRETAGVLLPSGEKLASMKFGTTGVKRIDGVSWEDVDAAIPGSVEWEPRLRSTLTQVKEACLSGDFDHLLTYEISESIGITKVKKGKKK